MTKDQRIELRTTKHQLEVGVIRESWNFTGVPSWVHLFGHDRSNTDQNQREATTVYHQNFIKQVSNTNDKGPLNQTIIEEVVMTFGFPKYEWTYKRPEKKIHLQG